MKQEARAYKEQREVAAVRHLIEAFQRNDVAGFERILQVYMMCMYVCVCLCDLCCVGRVRGRGPHPSAHGGTKTDPSPSP